ncbi:hypothetical protein QZH47_11025 [Pseudomonas corrugata]
MNLSVAITPSGLRGLLIRSMGPVATIAVAQLFGTSLWFSANSTAEELMRAWNATSTDIGWLTNAVQLGFILGTLSLSLSGAADRFRASTLFVCSAIVGALFNLGFAWLAEGLLSGAMLRFGVGITLAGIYPMGMKLIVGWAPQRTGLAPGSTGVDADPGHRAAPCLADGGCRLAVAGNHHRILGAGARRCGADRCVGRGPPCSYRHRP